MSLFRVLLISLVGIELIFVFMVYQLIEYFYDEVKQDEKGSSTHTEGKFDFLHNPGDAVECLADGSPDNALLLNGKRQPMNGNSFAPPIICGIIALLIEKKCSSKY